MPGMSRSCASSMRTTGSGHGASVSAADRYARILKALAPLISSRSATSANTCAIARLSTHQSVALEAVVEHARSAVGQRLGDRVAAARGAVTEQAAATAGAAHLRRGG